MHFEVLVEDKSGSIALEKILPKILRDDDEHTWKIIPYKGIGRLPKNLHGVTDREKRILLDRLPSLKKAGYPDTGMAKCDWAERIAPHIDVDSNESESFQVFRDGVRNLAGVGAV